MNIDKWREALLAAAKILTLIAALLGTQLAVRDGCWPIPPPCPIPAPPPVPPPPPPPPQPDDQADPVQATVQLRVGSSGCTATITRHRDQAGRRLIITAAHCVGGPGTTGEVRLRDGRRLPVEVVVRERGPDVAILATPDVRGLPHAEQAGELPAAGDRVWHQGYGVDRPGNREEGEIVRPDTGTGQTAMRLRVSSGDSGSGIFRADTGHQVSVVCCTSGSMTYGAHVRAIRAALQTALRQPAVDTWQWQPAPVPDCDAVTPSR